MDHRGVHFGRLLGCDGRLEARVVVDAWCGRPEVLDREEDGEEDAGEDGDVRGRPAEHHRQVRASGDVLVFADPQPRSSVRFIRFLALSHDCSGAPPPELWSSGVILIMVVLLYHCTGTLYCTVLYPGPATVLY